MCSRVHYAFSEIINEQIKLLCSVLVLYVSMIDEHISLLNTSVYTASWYATVSLLGSTTRMFEF